MSINNSGFFNAVNGDRTYSAEELGMMFEGVINDGIFQNYLNSFAPHIEVFDGSSDPPTALITIGSGRGWFNHKWIYYGESLDFEVDFPELGSFRIDAAVIKIDNSVGVRAGSIYIKEGTVNSNNRPEMTITDDIYEVPIAYFTLSHVSSEQLTLDTVDVREYIHSLLSDTNEYAAISFRAIDPERTAIIYVDYHGTDEDSPIPEYGSDWSWTVINLYNSGEGKTTQIVFCPIYPYYEKMWYRHRHQESGGNNYIWTVWYEIDPNLLKSIGDTLSTIGSTTIMFVENEIDLNPAAVEGDTDYAELTSLTGTLGGWYIATQSIYINAPSSASSGNLMIRMSVYPHPGDLANEVYLHMWSYGGHESLKGGTTIAASKPFYVPPGTLCDIDVWAFSSINANLTIHVDSKTNWFSITKIGDAPGDIAYPE